MRAEGAGPLTASRALLLLVLALAATFLSGLVPGPVPVGHDLEFTFRPKIEYGSEHYPALPGWHPRIYSGHPYTGNPQTMAFYPGALPLHIWGWSARLAYLLVFLHTLLGAIFCRLLCLRLGASEGGALVGATGWALGGQTMSRVLAGHLNWSFALPWMPLLFLGTLGLLRRGSMGAGAAAGLALGMMATCGAPQAAAYAGLGALGFGLVLLPGQAASPGRILRGSLGLLVTATLLLLPLALATLPFLEELAPGGRFARAHAAQGALTPAGLAGLLFPPLPGQPLHHVTLPSGNWDVAAYIGIPGLLLAWRGLVTRLDRTRAFFLGLLLFALLFALGELTPLFGLCQALPILGGFRAPGRMIVLAALALSILAALGYPRPGEAGRGRRRLAWSLGILWAGAALLACWPGSPAGGHLVHRILGLTLLGGGSLYLVLGKGWQQGATVVAILVLQVTSLFFLVGLPALQPHPAGEQGSLKAGLALTRTLDELPAGTEAHQYRVDHDDTGLLGLYPALNRRGLHSTRGTYDPGVAPTYRAWLNVLDRLRATDPGQAQHLWDLLAVRYRFATDGRLDQGREEGRRLAPRLWLIERRQVPPRFRWARQAKVLPSLEACLALHLDPTRQKPDPGETVTLLADQEKAPITAGGPGKVELFLFTPDRIELEINNQGAGYAVLSELHLPGWEAELDGRPLPLLRADGLFRACRVEEPGRHRLVLRNRHRSRPWYSLLGLLLCLVLAGRRVTARG